MPLGSSEDSLLLDLPTARPVGGGIHYILSATMRHSTRLHSQLRGRFGGYSSPRCLLGTTRPRFALLARSVGTYSVPTSLDKSSKTITIAWKAIPCPLAAFEARAKQGSSEPFLAGYRPSLPTAQKQIPADNYLRPLRQGNIPDERRLF
ncbi:hypothetical protein [Acidithiobacillus sp. IBUN Pt1247-S3]|uniref:hypothetical protein n=1 Tax=Acidithiobacillus sp. IBUN Pt1247-S3 TaxID=3166642 RepID=UPI0034E4030F